MGCAKKQSMWSCWGLVCAATWFKEMVFQQDSFLSEWCLPIETYKLSLANAPESEEALIVEPAYANQRTLLGEAGQCDDVYINDTPINWASNPFR